MSVPWQSGRRGRRPSKSFADALIRELPRGLPRNSLHARVTPVDPECPSIRSREKSPSARRRASSCRRGSLSACRSSMNASDFAFWLTLTGTLCWVVCFWWMYRISKKQNDLLEQLRLQGKRIEKVSKLEHELIKEVHPQVGEIKEGMDAVVTAVTEHAKKTGSKDK